MTDINESPSWEENIRLIARTERLSGGQDGVANRPLKSLANRTRYLKEQFEMIDGSKVDAEKSFLSGGTLSSPREEIIFENYRLVWTGIFPKEVPAGSTPDMTGGIGAGKWAYTSDAPLRQTLASNKKGDGGGVIRIEQDMTVQDAVNKALSRNTVRVENHFLDKGSQDDWSDVIEVLTLANPGATFIFPTGVGISRPIKYWSSITLQGDVRARRTTLRLLPGFVGDAAFEPISKEKQAVINASINHFLIIDDEGRPDPITLADGRVIDGRGTTSKARGIDITGTFNFSADDIVGNHLDSIIYADAGDETIWQTTQRARITRLDCSNCNRVIDAPGCTSANNFVYGDWVVLDIKTTGSVKYGIRIHDIDGLQVRGLSGFASFQVDVNGTQIVGLDLKPFDSKASIEDAARGISAETILIPERAGGGKSSIIHLLGVASTHAGRLADTTSGNPAPNNVGAFAIKARNVEGLFLDADITDPSMGGVDIKNCSRVHGRVNIRRVNTQNLGSGALTPGTYNSLEIDSCYQVDLQVNDMSPNRNYFLHSKNSNDIRIRGRVGRGAVLDRAWLIEDNMSSHDIDITLETETGFVRRNNGDSNYVPYQAALNSSAPNNIPSLNNILIQLNNTADTSVTDIPSVLKNQVVTINIRDNGATKLRNINGGGMFDGIEDYTKGRGTVLRFMRDPDRGFLVKI